MDKKLENEMETAIYRVIYGMLDCKSMMPGLPQDVSFPQTPTDEANLLLGSASRLFLRQR